MSAQGLASTVLWTQIVEAMRADGWIISDVAGPATTKLIREVVGEGVPVVSEVTRQLIERDQHGRQKYGTTLDRTDLSHGDWLQHMAEELMDGAGYALAAKREWERGRVPRDVLLAWRQDWLHERDHEDGRDIVTPFDAYLYFDAGAAPPMSPAGYRVQGVGVDPTTGGFASIKIDGVTFDSQLVARTMMRQAGGS